jgi:hypothetical protein
MGFLALCEFSVKSCALPVLDFIDEKDLLVGGLESADAALPAPESEH